jgi:5-methylcytosine-specific restriction endonuclease McrA
MPTSEKRARLLLERGRARVHKVRPFTIRIVDRLVEDSVLQPITLKIAPGSKVTGGALVRELDSVGELESKVLALIELEHRGVQIHKKMEQRSNYRRRRRSKNLRYRKPRFLNRRNKKKGWLAPSIQHRVDSTINIVKKLQSLVPVKAVALELTKYDTQKLQNPEISGVEYQQGELYGYEVREYLLEKWGRKCVYCGAENVALQIDHIVPKAKGGSNRVSNLTLACQNCNEKKGSKDLEEFLAKKSELARRILARAKAPLKAEAAVNSTRWALYRGLKELGLPLSAWTGGQTKYNRVRLGLPKTHALDAACVGEMGEVFGWKRPTLIVKSRGRGSYQRTTVTKHGFPRGYLTRSKAAFGFQTGDLVKAEVPKGKFEGTYVGRVAIRSSGSFNIQTSGGLVTTSHNNCRLLQKNDGYEWIFRSF